MEPMRKMAAGTAGRRIVAWMLIWALMGANPDWHGVDTVCWLALGKASGVRRPGTEETPAATFRK